MMGSVTGAFVVFRAQSKKVSADNRNRSEAAAAISHRDLGNGLSREVQRY